MRWRAARQVDGHQAAPIYGSRPRRSFTLVEMMVSIAVLTLALSVVGVVFSVTTQTATQAAAYSETQNWVRQFALQIEEDLAACEPSESVLIMVGRTQAAGLTADDVDAGRFHRVLVGNPADVPGSYDPEFDAGVVNSEYSNPRADLLAFFTNRAAPSVAPSPDYSDSPYANGAKFSPLFVVYGHAALGDPVWQGSDYGWPTAWRHIEDNGVANISPIPATQWHLARRATIIEADSAAASTFVDAAVRQRLVLCDAEDYHGDVAPLNLVACLNAFAWPNRCPYGSGSICDGLGDVYSQVDTTLEPLLYRDGTSDTRHHVATVLTEVPVNLRSNMGLHMLPGCVWFEVEFLMPEDPRNSLDYLPPEGYRARYMPRWTSVTEGDTYVFVPDTAENRAAAAGSARANTFRLLRPGGLDTLNNRRIRMWPYAIRVTVRVWDARAKLDEPLVRSVVHRFE